MSGSLDELKLAYLALLQLKVNLLPVITFSFFSPKLSRCCNSSFKGQLHVAGNHLSLVSRLSIAGLPDWSSLACFFQRGCLRL